MELNWRVRCQKTQNGWSVNWLDVSSRLRRTSWLKVVKGLGSRLSPLTEVVQSKITSKTYFKQRHRLFHYVFQTCSKYFKPYQWNSFVISSELEPLTFHVFVGSSYDKAKLRRFKLYRSLSIFKNRLKRFSLMTLFYSVD